MELFSLQVRQLLVHNVNTTKDVKMANSTMILNTFSTQAHVTFTLCCFEFLGHFVQDISLIVSNFEIARERKQQQQQQQQHANFVSISLPYHISTVQL